MGEFGDTYRSSLKACSEMLESIGFSLTSSFINGVRPYRYIHKIIINDPCVILIDRYGRKWIVKAQEGDEFENVVGTLLVICKYLYPSKRYSDILTVVDHLYLDEKASPVYFLNGAIMSILGFDLVTKIMDEVIMGRLQNQESYTIYVSDILKEMGEIE